MEEKLNVLVAIDEVPGGLWDNLRSLAEFQFVRDGAEAYHQLTSQSFDLALVDLNLTGMDGLELLRRIRLEGLCSYVILTSSVPSFSYAQQGILYGASAYLLRPLKEAEVEEAMRKLCFHHSDELLHNAAVSVVKKLRSGSCEEAFSQAGEQLLSASGDSISAAICWRNFYLEVVNLTYLQYPWMKLYHQAAEFSALDHIWDQDIHMVRHFCLRKIRLLGDSLTELFPPSDDHQLEQIQIMLLQSVDQDPQQKDVAEHFYIANSTLSTRFQRVLHLSYREYLTRIKIQRAQYLLSYTDIQPDDLASLLGYKDKNYFYKVFFQRTGQNLKTKKWEHWSDFHI